MNLQIKALSGSLQEEQKKYIRKRFLWFDEKLPNGAVLTIGVKEHITKRSNQAYEIFVHLDSPKTKKPIYVRSFGNNFSESIDRSKEKLERIVLRLKEKSGFKLKVPSFGFKFLKKKDEKSV